MADAGERLLGRDAELDLLNAAMSALPVTGTMEIVQLVGEAGIGKSRLIAELHRAGDEAGWTVLSGRASEFESEMPFALFIDALDDFLASLDLRALDGLDAQARAELGTVFPAFVPLAGDAPVAVHAERHRTYRAVRTLLQSLSVPKPVVITLDDAHWADAASTELLAYLVAHPPASQILLVTAFRPVPVLPPLSGALDAAAKDGRATRVVLRPLTRSEADELIGTRVAPVGRDAIYQDSGGNPFYLEQLSRATDDGRAPRQRKPPAGHDGAVPHAVRAALTSELATLPTATRELLRAAAVIGDPFELSLAAAVGGMEPAQALALVDALLELDLIRPTDVPTLFRFRHPIVRRAVYEAAGAGWRLQAHARAAETLRQRGASLGAVAHHLGRSAGPGDLEAMEVLVQAAEGVAPRAPASAAGWYATALGLLPEGEQHDPRRVQLLVAQASAMGAAGQLAESHAALLEALRRLPSDPPPVGLVAYCAMIEHLQGRQEQGRDRLFGALTRLVDHESADAVALKIALSTTASYSRDCTTMLRWAEEALATSRTLGSNIHSASAGGLAAHATFQLGRTSDARDHTEAAAALLDELDDQMLGQRVDAALWVGMAEAFLEEYDDAIRHFERGIGVSRLTGQGQFLLFMMHLQCWSLAAKGRLGEARRLAEEATEAARVAGQAYALVATLFELSVVASLQGDLAGAIAAGEEGVRISQELDAGSMGAAVGTSLGLALLEAGEPQRARRTILEMGGGPDLPMLGRALMTRAYETLARAEIRVGSVEQAQVWADRAEEATDGFSLPLEGAIARRARAAAVLASGDTKQAAELFLSAAEDAANAGAPVEAARASLLAGRALAHAGLRDDAVAQLERAESELASHGAGGYREEASRELRRLGRGRSRADTGAPGLGRLTEREREIAHLVVSGLTNREIAAACYLSEKTVERHLTHMFAKLEVSSRSALAGVVSRYESSSGVQHGS